MLAAGRPCAANHRRRASPSSPDLRTSPPSPPPRTPASQVQLVVQGGPGTLVTVASTAAKGHPIVLMVDSGGAAAAIHQYLLHGISHVEEKFQAKEQVALMLHAATLLLHTVTLKGEETFKAKEGPRSRRLTVTLQLHTADPLG